MNFDLAFVLIDLGEPWYKTAASEMIRSARRAYKDHDMRIVQLTDSRTAHHPDADGVFTLATEVGKDQMCQAKGHLIAEYALQADRPVIFTDVDIIWNNDVLLKRMKPHTIGVMERESPECMPYNTGVIWTNEPKVAFWQEFRAICDSLPAEVCGWWGDQFAMAVIAGKFDPGVFNAMPMWTIAPAIDALPDKPLDTPAVHFKGGRKSMMIPYARMLDKGEGFEFVRPAHAVRVKSGPGEITMLPPEVQPQNVTVRDGWAF